MMRKKIVFSTGSPKVAGRLKTPLLFCILAFSLALGQYSMLPIAFVESDAHDKAELQLQDARFWQEASDTLWFLRANAKDQSVRQASAYTVGTFLAQSSNPNTLSLAEYALEEAVYSDPSDEAAKENLEIVRLKKNSLFPDSVPSDLDEKLKKGEITEPKKEPKEDPNSKQKRPFDKGYGRGGSTEEDY